MRGVCRSRCAAAELRAAGRIAFRGECAAAGLLAGLLVLSNLFAPVASAETLAPADESREAQQAAQQLLPLDQLSEEARGRLGDVIARPTIYRRLPTEVVACDPEMYLTLVRNPDIIVSIWRKMHVTDVTMQCTSPFHYQCDDKAGTVSQVELIYGTPHMHVYYADSLYEGPLLARPVKCRVVLLLRTEYSTDEAGQPLATSQMDAFIRIEHLTANLIARTLSPLVGRSADHNFTESLRFVGRINETAEENGPGVQQMAMRLEGVDLATREKFAAVSGAVAQRANLRLGEPEVARAAPGEDVDPRDRVDEAQPATQSTSYRLLPRTTQWRR